MKKTLSVLTGLAIAATLALPALANHHMGKGHAKGHAKGHNSRMHSCGKGKVKVTGNAAWLKAMPEMGARTLRTARRGETFWVVTDAKGHAHHWNGWWLVKASNGHRFWLHQSVAGCG